ncbi:OsmC family protein [Pseudalkalibacillus caeni]|uniref:OsmC family protein n=1 Tax=Exobacillus caeni TaxID=2574798 RepID=A0A5R9EXZ5_9BACL|nr:OsmC family protein [Pseudalkalibacillus caeni]TLS35731.1 OsmC family protein [Pseudalkalibacillus caeni]
MEYKMKDHGFSIDLEYGTLDICGDETYGFRPYQLLVSSVAVCSGGVLRQILDKKRMVYEDISIKADIKRNEEEANRVEEIHLHFTIKGNLDEKKVQKAMELTTKHCSMVQSVKDSIKVEETFEIIA